jgi:hypothetical protein
MDGKRRSRFSRTSNGRNLSEDGRVLIKLLRELDPEWRYPCLPTDWLAAITGHVEKYVKTIALDAAREPHFFTGRKDYHFKSSVIWREQKGDELLIRKGYLSRRSRRTKAQRAHDILDSIIDASIELGVRKQPDLELLTWRDILQHPKTPQAIKDSLDPFRITLANGKDVLQDGRPFALRHKLNGALGFFKETDRDSEDLSGSARITIDKKLDAWKEIFEQRLYHKIYGFPRAMLLFITINESRERKIHERIKARIGSCSWILTKTTDDFEQSHFSVKPHTKILDEPFNRVGFPPFDLRTLSDATERAVPDGTTLAA